MPSDTAAFADSAALTDRLRQLAVTGTPQVRVLAAWLADRPEELAFHSVRTLAARAGTNANTVIRLARALGFPAFEPCRKAAQEALRASQSNRVSYDARVGALVGRTPDELIAELRDAARTTVEAVFSAAMTSALTEAASLIRAARRVHCIGVRSCFGLANYFAYVGALAHENIAPAPMQPGLIMEALSECGPEDVVIAITFAHYSSEVVRAADVARARGARLIAITDSHVSPIATGAALVLRPPMQGPHVMPSMAGAFLLIETMLALMAARDEGAQARVRRFEQRMREIGAYVSVEQTPQA